MYNCTWLFPCLERHLDSFCAAPYRGEIRIWPSPAKPPTLRNPSPSAQDLSRAKVSAAHAHAAAPQTPNVNVLVADSSSDCPAPRRAIPRPSLVKQPMNPVAQVHPRTRTEKENVCPDNNRKSHSTVRRSPLERKGAEEKSDCVPKLPKREEVPHTHEPSLRHQLSSLANAAVAFDQGMLAWICIFVSRRWRTHNQQKEL